MKVVTMMSDRNIECHSPSIEQTNKKQIMTTLEENMKGKPFY